jgi:SAM-dependent methyltransferase
MPPQIYKKFEEIISQFDVSRVLEIGAVPSTQSLLTSHCLVSAEKVGLNLVAGRFRDFEIVEGNTNNMDFLSDASFDCVLCNAVLEHDKYFWKSISEMKRVLAPGGLLAIGTPSYRNFSFHGFTKFIKGANRMSSFLRLFTFCARVHNAPGDYYRFSEQTFAELFFEGFCKVKIESLLIPPITVGYGLKNP